LTASARKCVLVQSVKLKVLSGLLNLSGRPVELKKLGSVRSAVGSLRDLFRMLNLVSG